MEDKVKKWYVTRHLKFDPKQMVAATLVFEGTAQEVRAQEKEIYSIALKYGGLSAGAEPGIRGYFLTYMIAYLRDFGLEYSFIGESFETSVPYENVLTLCEKTKDVIRRGCLARGVKTPPMISCRVTQLYDNGVCVYFYFGFSHTGLKDPVGTFSEIEHEARDEIIRHGGSLSHHHGVGKLRKHWVEPSISSLGVDTFRAIKNQLDPKNTFGAQNVV